MTEATIVTAADQRALITSEQEMILRLQKQVAVLEAEKDARERGVQAHPRVIDMKIASLREVTPEMIVAAWETARKARPQGRIFVCSGPGFKEIYQAMFDVAAEKAK